MTILFLLEEKREGININKRSAQDEQLQRTIKKNGMPASEPCNILSALSSYCIPSAAPFICRLLIDTLLLCKKKGLARGRNALMILPVAERRSNDPRIYF